MRCARCQAENRGGREFCVQCGARLLIACPTCGGQNDPDDKFCGGCGKLLGRAAGRGEALASLRVLVPRPAGLQQGHAGSALEGQRRQVTVLFTDLVGFTPLSERLGEEAVYELIQPIFQLMIDAVHQQNGTVQELTGDGIMAIFGAPVALEDAPVRACRAALDIQQRMTAFSEELQTETGFSPRIRVGIHTGPVVIGKLGDDLRVEFTAVGDTVNLASRLESTADPGTIVISEATHRLVEGYIESRFLGEQMVKGKSEPQRIYRVESFRSGVTRFDVSVDRGLAAFVGRRREMENLDRCWVEANEGRVRVVDVVGEPGIGKSRLIYEFRQRISERPVAWLQGHCLAGDQVTAFLPFIEVVRAYFGIGEHETADDIKKVEDGVRALDLDRDQSLPYLLNLLGLQLDGKLFRKEDAELSGIRTRAALHQLLLERCHRGPVIMFIDDLHWIDEASEEYLRWAAQIEDLVPLLILCTYRPQYEPPWRELGNVASIHLEPLSSNSTVELLRSRARSQNLPDELVRLAAEKAEGNPLFAEEMANHLAAKNAGQSGADVGRVPLTIEGLLVGRVDRLRKNSQAVLETASVMGRQFSLDLLGAAAGVNGAVATIIDELAQEDLIVCDTADGECRFKHGLIRDAIYNRLLRPRREELHGKVAEAIERMRPDRLDEATEILAYHYTQTRHAAKAVRYAALAGERSLRLYSLSEAEQRFRNVIDLIREAPACADDTFLVEVLLKQARVFYFQADFAGLIHALQPYLSVAEGLESKRLLSRYLFELGYAHVFSGRGDIGKPLLERGLQLGEQIDDPESIGYACLGLSWQYTFWEPVSDRVRKTVQTLADRAILKGTAVQDNWLTSKALVVMALNRLMSGRPNESRQYCERLFALSQETGDPRPRAMGLWALAYLNGFNLRCDEAIENADEALRISLGPVDRLNAEGAKAVALTMSGRIEEALELFRDVRSRLMAGRFLSPIVAIDFGYGVAILLGGEMTKGVRWIEETMNRLASWGYESGPSLGHLYLGEIYLRIALGEDRPTIPVLLRNLGFVIRTVPFAARKARGHLEEAIREWRRLDAPGFLARSLLDLGLLYAFQNRQTQARACLDEALELAGSVDAGAVYERAQTALQALRH